MLRKNPLKQLDLNLLRLFIYIFELKNLTHTAEALHLSQSAISHALGRLRQALGDELFYREKGELHPPRCMPNGFIPPSNKALKISNKYFKLTIY